MPQKALALSRKLAECKPLTRGIFFIPMFTLFVMRVHKQTVYADIPNALTAGYNSFSKMLGAKAGG